VVHVIVKETFTSHRMTTIRRCSRKMASTLDVWFVMAQYSGGS